MIGRWILFRSLMQASLADFEFFAIPVVPSLLLVAARLTTQFSSDAHQT